MARDVRDAELTAGRSRPYTGMPTLSPERNDIQTRVKDLEDAVSQQMLEVGGPYPSKPSPSPPPSPPPPSPTHTLPPPLPHAHTHRTPPSHTPPHTHVHSDMTHCCISNPPSGFAPPPSPFACTPPCLFHLQLRTKNLALVEMESREQKLLADLKSRCQKVWFFFVRIFVHGLRACWRALPFPPPPPHHSPPSSTQTDPLARQVVELQEVLDAKEEELKASAKAVKREKMSKMANDVGGGVRLRCRRLHAVHTLHARWL
jgi:hypothetical protein